MSIPKLLRHGDIVDRPAYERDGYAFTSVNRNSVIQRVGFIATE